MVVLDATTGKPVQDFVNGGFITGANATSAPAIYKDFVITGGGDGRIPSVSAWNIRTGARVWTFHTVPQAGEPGNETWENDSWKTATGTNVWGFISVDVERGLAFLPISQPSNDFYGGERHGNNLYGDSLVALNANTGKLVWYQQIVHHDMWDYDLSAAPALMEIVRNGRRVPAVAQITKMGLMFIFDRTTGTPIFGIEERSVPQSEVPGEASSSTQPFPVKPAPLARNSMTKADLATVTPEHAAFCKDLWEKNQMYNDGPYTPYDTERNAVILPGTIGGGNWNGVSSDPALGYIFVNITNAGQLGHLEKRDASTPPRGRGGRGGAAPAQEDGGPAPSAYNKVAPIDGGLTRARFWNPETQWGCTAPPWGELIAVNANTGDIAWRVPLGAFDELEAKGIKTGVPNVGGSIATAGGLVFIAATIDSRFRAFDARSGKELWSAKLAANGHAIPSTYMGKDGKQYVVIPAGGGGFLYGKTADSLTAFSLP
jgi:quinoprotein glucose dehydrogenase